MNRHIFFFFLFFLQFSNCEKQNTNNVVETKIEETGTDQSNEFIIENSENILSLVRYYGMVDVFAPDGKMLCAYNDKTMETLWGPIFSPILYLYDKEKKVLAKYNTIDLVSEDFWPGNILSSYNKERNSFDMVFCLDAIGNYGTGYIDLSTNKFIRELLEIPRDSQFELEFGQGIPDDYVEGSNLEI